MTITAVSEDALSPAERRRRKVRDAIIHAAEAIFTEEGEAGLSMRRIAERIDYSPAALYKYFDSKEALFREIRESFFERLHDRMKAVGEEVEVGPMLGSACIRAYVDTGLEQPGHYKLAFSSFPDIDDHPEETYAYAVAEYLDRIIQLSIEQGWFRPLDLKLAAKSVWAATHGLTQLAVTIPQFPCALPVLSDHEPNSCGLSEEHVRAELDRLITFHADTILRGLGTARLVERLDAGERF
ncbi:TetR/AcrR family transcriptional regulator [Oceanicaulis sp. LC35]|uniref:TetR/AcrR family transcriptional regulator n=1 Tax=Oceanicaulis sp. LC35 TaxID=3349635 RepID=UPI003F837222